MYMDKKHSVYIIRSKDVNCNALYVGRTMNFYKRHAHHKCHANKTANNQKTDLHLYKCIRDFGGWDKFEMFTIRRNLTYDEACLIERDIYDTLKPYMNYNKPLRTRDEYYKENRAKYNKNSIVRTYLHHDEAKKKWTKRNEKFRKKINADMKEYYTKNRERICKMNKIKYGCVCGQQICNRGRKTHLHSYTHEDGVILFKKQLIEMRKKILGNTI